MYSNLFSAQSVQDLMTVLPSLPFAIWETFYVTAVSYTHLDVYKRQVCVSPPAACSTSPLSATSDTCSPLRRDLYPQKKKALAGFLFLLTASVHNPGS